MYTALAEENV